MFHMFMYVVKKPSEFSPARLNSNGLSSRYPKGYTTLFLTTNTNTNKHHCAAHSLMWLG